MSNYCIIHEINLEFIHIYIYNCRNILVHKSDTNYRQIKPHKTVNITKRDLKKIRKALPTGSFDEISKRTGLGLASVKASLFYPERIKTIVVEAALLLIAEEKAKVESLKTSIKELI